MLGRRKAIAAGTVLVAATALGVIGTVAGGEQLRAPDGYATTVVTAVANSSPAVAGRPVQELDLTSLGSACAENGLCVEVTGSFPEFELTISVGGEKVNTRGTTDCTIADAPYVVTGSAQAGARGGEVSLVVPTDSPEVTIDGAEVSQVIVALPEGARLQLAYATVDGTEERALMASANRVVQEFGKYARNGGTDCVPSLPVGGAK